MLGSLIGSMWWSCEGVLGEGSDCCDGIGIGWCCGGVEKSGRGEGALYNTHTYIIVL